MSFTDVANSPLLFALCFIVIAIVFAQSIIFIRTAWKRGKEVGIESSVMKKTMTNSAVFSIIPTLPIIIMLMTLSVPLGKYFPWMRLSVVGSATYEGMAAGMVAEGSGLTGINDPNMTASIFTTAMWVMTIGIIWGIVFNIFFMKSLDKLSKKMKASNNTFMPILSSALFLGMLSVLSIPHIANVKNPVGILAFAAAAISAILCNLIAKHTKIRAIDDFSLPISLILGMAVSIIYTQVAV